MENESEVTLKSIASQLERIEKQLSKKDQKSKEEKDWKDLWELGGLFLLGAGIIYLFINGGIAAVIEWVKNIFLLGS
jgi:hypothetical protein